MIKKNMIAVALMAAGVANAGDLNTMPMAGSAVVKAKVLAAKHRQVCDIPGCRGVYDVFAELKSVDGATQLIKQTVHNKPGKTIDVQVGMTVSEPMPTAGQGIVVQGRVIEEKQMPCGPDIDVSLCTADFEYTVALDMSTTDGAVSTSLVKVHGFAFLDANVLPSESKLGKMIPIFIKQ